MRTYLQLVQRLHQEADLPGNPPTTVTGHAAGSEPQRLCDWIADALIDIYRLHPDWIFRRRALAGFPTTNGQGTYTQAQCGVTAGTVGRWMLDTFRAYLTSGGITGEYRLHELPYNDWRDLYLFGSNRTNYGAPRHVARHPETNGLVLGPIPLGGYTILGEYYLAPTAGRLAANGDLPNLPEQHDSLGIVWKALLEYGGFEASSDTYQRAFNHYTQFISLMEAEELPTPTLCLGW